MTVSESQARPGDSARATRSDEERFAAQRLESLGRLAGGVAHDFNNVLGVILGYVELARMQLGPESVAAAGHLAQALSTLDRARALTARLLAFVHGRGTEEDGRVDPNAVVDDLRDLLTETLDRRVAIRVTLANDTPWIEIERERLAHALLNLCLDAAERMPQGGLLALDVRRSEYDRDSIGIPPGTYARIDVRDAAHPQPAPGESPLPGASGTFDAACELAVSMGGTATRGRDDLGTVTSLWLPSFTPTTDPEVESEPDSDTAVARILIVDDEPGVREVTRAHLEHAGYAVREAETAERAIDLVSTAPELFDAILLDLHLPDRSGVDVYELLETIKNPPALVIVTGDLERADAAGIPAETPRLAKPYLRQGLLDVVRAALEAGGRPKRPS